VFKGTPVLHVGLTNDILHSVLKKGCGELQCLDLCGSPQLLTDYAVDLIGRYKCRGYMNLFDGFSIRGLDIRIHSALPPSPLLKKQGEEIFQANQVLCYFFSTLTLV